MNVRVVYASPGIVEPNQSGSERIGTLDPPTGDPKEPQFFINPESWSRTSMTEEGLPLDPDI